MEQKSIQYSEYCDWAFGLNRIILNLLGIWSNDHKVAYLKSLRIPFMLMWITMVLFLPMIYALVKVCPNLTLIIDNTITSGACFLTLAKLFLAWLNRQVLDPLVHWMTDDWMREKASWELDLMLRQAQRGRLFTISGYGIMVSTLAGFIFTPFLKINMRIVNNITDLDERRYFPMQTYYPYDFVESPNFELTYVAQLIAIVFTGMSFSAADNFFGVLVFHAAGQCEILTVELAKLFEDIGFEEKQSFKEKLCFVVRRHVHLVRFVLMIEKSFNISILVHTLFLSVTMCCAGYAFISSFANENMSSPIIQIAMLVLVLFNIMLHMLVYCMATETLTSNSKEFLQAIYDSDWYLFPSNYSRDVIPLMMRSHYPLRLTAGKFFDLSLNAFLMILKSSAGYISMLLAVS